ncbi:NACHT domain-containing protein [Streptomyces sp. NPDC048483]|uniref:NACHT domain-containing protein n=1 Tax=Streptomyces sp. NPDC048483 TaxID=3154927 RepID=UPI00341F6A64
MNYVIRHPQGKLVSRSTPLLVRPRRYVSHVADALEQLLRRLLVRLAARRKVAPARRWRMKWSRVALLQRFSVLAVVLVVFWVGSAVYAIVTHEKSPVQRLCSATGSGSGSPCAVVYGFLSPFLSLGLATFVFLLVQYVSVRRPLTQAAKKNPSSIVPTAGPTITDVVGRKEMCSVISRALRDRRTRRPYLLVGGVGTGKTSVLVQLTQMLAKKGAVPVPVRLRDVDLEGSHLDFRELGMKRFCEAVDRDALSRRQSERVWRQLCMDDRVVIIADGLEETFAEDEKQKKRDLLIRHAIQRAEHQKLPLVIATRPHAPLEHTQAAVIDLEPLSEEAALEYLGDHADSDSHRMEWIVKTAAVSESPLYLQIARQLRDHDLFKHMAEAKGWAELDTRNADRTALQWRLLTTWREALIKGRLHGEIALPCDQRTILIEVVSALAAIGLLRDRLEVRIDELIEPDREGADPAAAQRSSSTSREERVTGEIREHLAKNLKDLCPRETSERRCRALLSLCATEAERLGLVETRAEKVRFQHSLVQAYLGAGYLDVCSDGPLNFACEEPGPGRELLIALVLNSRAALRDRQDASAQAKQTAVVQKLLDVAQTRTDAKVFDMYAAALEIDRAAGAAKHQEIARILYERWEDIKGSDRRTLEVAQQVLLQRFGEVLRAIGEAENNEHDPAHGRVPAYEWLIRIATLEPSYPLRLAIAQEIGAGGDRAFDALRTMFPLSKESEESDPWVQYEWESSRQLQRDRRTREIFLGVRPDNEQTRAEYDKRVTESNDHYSEIWRRFVLRAWLVPMMVGSVGDKHREQAKERLSIWLRHLEPEHSGSERADLPRSLEIALAQGFKCAANRRRRHPHSDDKAREFLVAQAESMLSHARFWYSQMTLIHALCLWELPDRAGTATSQGPGGSDGAGPDSEVLKDDGTTHEDGTTADSGDPGRTHPSVQADPTQAVMRWLVLAGSKQDPRALQPGDRTRKGDRLHPFVAEAANLAVLALESGHPERFLWIDEIGAMNNIGSSPVEPGAHCKHSLWMPPSVGWSSLHPRAQQLLADVLLLLNLTEWTGRPAELEERLERADQTVLPPCLTKDRAPLRPRRTVGVAEHAPPGSTCLRDCPFQLCPYPAMGRQPRAELRETFCRQQQALLRGYHTWNPLSWLQRKRAPWQGMTAAELRQFWEDMAVRSRIPS